MLRILLLLLAATGAAAAQPASPPRLACTDIAGLDLSAELGHPARIEAAAELREGWPAPACHLRGTIAPAIGFEVWLPINAWSGRYLQVGCGGLCGSIRPEVPQAAGCLPLERGEFALAATDMGHRDPTAASWGQDSGRRLDFAFRAVHLTGRAAKLLIARFYGEGPRRSYFSGCSDGGREAIMAALRYPSDFDGVAAGAPALDFTVQNSFHHSWTVQSNRAADGRPALTADRLPVLHRLVLAACDALDGAADGVLADPLGCDFDPRAATCAAGADSATCLTAEEALAAAAIYDGPRTAAGERLTAGGLLRGSEANWRGTVAPASPSEPPRAALFAGGVLRYLAFPPGDTDVPTPETLRFDAATLAHLGPSQALFDATGTDLSAFFARGGRLILWHGLADQDISPTTTLAWWRALRRDQGEARTEEAVRLFLVPGLAHCQGGTGATRLDTLTPLLRWVEDGVAPDRIKAQDGPPVFAFPARVDARPEPFLGAERFGPTPLAWCVGATCAAR